jgi:ribosomal protein L11 methyltransferase
LNWLQLSIQTDKQHADSIEQALETAGALSVTATDAADQPLLEPAPGETPLWDQLIMTGLFTADSDRDVLLNVIMQSGLVDDPMRISIEELPDQEWTRAWMEYFKPMPFGERLWICPQGYEPPCPDAVNMRLDPGLAFGTGTHPTTALCLEWLDSQSLNDCHILDYGCGSGILAIAALLLGARSAWCVDNDEQALIATQSNAEKNQVDKKIQCYFPQDLPATQVDIVVANILAGPLLELAPVLAKQARTGGRIALSGILLEQSDEVEQLYQQWFDMKPAICKDGWVLLQGIRNSNRNYE